MKEELHCLGSVLVTFRLEEDEQIQSMLANFSIHNGLFMYLGAQSIAYEG